MKCIAIYIAALFVCWGMGLILNWGWLTAFGWGLFFPFATACVFGPRCTFAKSITQIVLTKAGIWRAQLKSGKAVCEYLKAWYERK